MKTKPTTEMIEKWATIFIDDCCHDWKPAIDPDDPTLLGVKGCKLCGEYTTNPNPRNGPLDFCSDLNLTRKILEKLWSESDSVKEKFVAEVMREIENRISEYYDFKFGDEEEWYDRLVLIGIKLEILVLSAYRTMEGTK